jgi:hypothetical protein
MSKKHTDEDEFEDEFQNEEDSFIDGDDEDDIDEDGDIEMDEDDDNLDIIIEIDDEDDISDDVSEKTDELDDVVLYKHKIEGKHSLKYDSIFKGKKEDPVSEDDFDSFADYFNSSIEVDKSSQYHVESIDNESYVRDKLVKERVYAVLTEHTTINFLNNRRKPSKNDFNHYFSLLKTHLKDESFTNTELFNELAVYFSDNIFNMFKLLEPKWINLIISELQDHIGRNNRSKEVINRNIYEGTEVEFVWVDPILEDDRLITGVVIETDYPNSMFKIDSYENIYEVSIKDITKILNNTKFKYNLNKLNNIDFL